MTFEIKKINPFGILILAIESNSKVDELNIATLKSYVNQHQLLVLRGFQSFSGSNEFSTYCERWGNISIWPFGKVLEIIEQQNPTDHIFDHSYVPLHWDGMYRPQVPEFQIFHCACAPLANQGGRTTFSNTLNILKEANSEQIERWNKITGIYQRKMEFYDSKITAPIITLHPINSNPVIRYCEPPLELNKHFINPPNIEFLGLPNEPSRSFHTEIRDALYNPKNFYCHEWKTGDIVIADNFSLLHGREEFISKSPRHIQRVHIDSNPPFNNPHLEYHR